MNTKSNFYVVIIYFAIANHYSTIVNTKTPFPEKKGNEKEFIKYDDFENLFSLLLFSVLVS